MLPGRRFGSGSSSSSKGADAESPRGEQLSLFQDLMHSQMSCPRDDAHQLTSRSRTVHSHVFSSIRDHPEAAPARYHDHGCFLGTAGPAEQLAGMQGGPENLLTTLELGEHDYDWLMSAPVVNSGHGLNEEEVSKPYSDMGNSSSNGLVNLPAVSKPQLYYAMPCVGAEPSGSGAIASSKVPDRRVSWPIGDLNDSSKAAALRAIPKTSSSIALPRFMMMNKLQPPSNILPRATGGLRSRDSNLLPNSYISRNRAANTSTAGHSLHLNLQSNPISSSCHHSQYQYPTLPRSKPPVTSSVNGAIPRGQSLAASSLAHHHHQVGGTIGEIDPMLSQYQDHLTNVELAGSFPKLFKNQSDMAAATSFAAAKRISGLHMNPMLIPASDSIGSYGRSRSIADLSMDHQFRVPIGHRTISMHHPNRNLIPSNITVDPIGMHHYSAHGIEMRRASDALTNSSTIAHRSKNDQTVAKGVDSRVISIDAGRRQISTRNGASQDLHACRHSIIARGNSYNKCELCNVKARMRELNEKARGRFLKASS